MASKYDVWTNRQSANTALLRVTMPLCTPVAVGKTNCLTLTQACAPGNIGAAHKACGAQCCSRNA
eukprot:1915385-Lingulodinium_polyedra.AAC.1